MKYGRWVSLKHTKVVENARLIKAAIFDGDGVITDNRVLEGFLGSKPRWRSHYDGQGISLLRAIGIKVCFITNETGESARSIEGLVERWNSLPSTSTWGEVGLWTGSGGNTKVEVAQEWLSKNGLGWDSCSVMGDDLVDVPLLRKVAFPVAPAQAEKVVKEIALFVTERPGGAGAVRDFVNFILRARGIDPTTLPFN